ncbi:hypothetical protein AI2903V1_3348 [Klebsiella pneumoniae]|nr:hypothetical protein AI2903V1_3348 [Klebsiella pneumoniae]CAH5903224.1 hypothetical protein AI2903V1_3348 [Klebsiella pneumoniae]
MTVRAKFSCISIHKSLDNHSAVVNLSAVTTSSTENYTPSGQLQMLISNLAVLGQFEQGKEYFIDISPAD